MHTRRLDRRPIRSKRAEDLGRIDDALQQACGHVVPAGHDLHRDRRARKARAHVVQIIGAHEPRLVGEDVEAGVVQAADRPRLAAIPAGEDDDVTATLIDQSRARVPRGDDVDTPPCRILRPAVEPLDERQEITPLRAVRRVHDHVVVDARMRHAQRQRRVEMARVQDEQPMLSHGRRRRMEHAWHGGSEVTPVSRADRALETS